MARRMLSLAALLSPRRWRSAPAVRCLQSTCNRLRVTYMSSLRSLCRAVQGQAELASSNKALAITASAICYPTKSSRYAIRYCSVAYEQRTRAVEQKNSGLGSQILS